MEVVFGKSFLQQQLSRGRLCTVGDLVVVVFVVVTGGAHAFPECDIINREIVSATTRQNLSF
jgi:hypothetical protein